MIVFILFIVFYVVAVYFCFKAYREFKGMLYDNGMGGAGGGLGNMMMRGANSN